jgi:Holliday junction DNA helicase RuvB
LIEEKVLGTEEPERRITSPAPQEDENVQESLRPVKFDEFIGQSSLKEKLKIFIEAANQRNEALDHVLLSGQPGLGKTTFARIISQHLHSNFIITSGPAIERQGDLAAILTNLGPRDLLFVDEIHRLKLPVEEILYSAMEDFKLDIIVGKGPEARTLRLDLPPFTLVGATTRAGLLSAPLRDRFGIMANFDYYSPAELARIVKRSAGLLGITVTMDAAMELATRSRGTPRIANRLLKRVRDIAQVRGDAEVGLTRAKEALELLHVNEKGLEKIDLRILNVLTEHYQGAPVGLSTLSISVGEAEDTIEEVYEPYLIQLGFLERTPRGRRITARGQAYYEDWKQKSG